MLYTMGHLLTRGVELGSSEGQEAIVDKGLCQVVLKVLQGALTSDNGLQGQGPTSAYINFTKESQHISTLTEDMSQAPIHHNQCMSV